MIQGVPRNLKVVITFELYSSLTPQPTFTYLNLETIIHKILQVLKNFQNVVCLFCARLITGDIENFVQISILLNKTKIVEI